MIKLDHIAIAVENLEQGRKFFDDLGLEFARNPVTVESEGVRVDFAKVSGSARIELLEPLGKESPVQKFIDKKGPGIHHLSFGVKNLETITSSLIKKGYKFIYEIPRVGADGHLINFVHPKSTGGILIELAEVE